MNRSRRLSILGIALAALAAAPLGSASAQPASDFPNRPVTFVVPFPPGGASDIFARMLGQKLSVQLGQPFVVENRAGATGLIGTQYVARAKPDGYTLLVASNSSQVIAPLLKTTPPFDSVKDFEPITMLGRYPFALDVNPKVPARTVQELVALAKKSPGKLNFGSIGDGSGTHLVAEMFKQRTGIDITHIPYKGTAALGTALVAGEIDIQFDSVGAAKPLVDSGRVRALAVTGSKRSPLLPNVPSLAEEGFDKVDATIWIGAFAPKGTPHEVVAKVAEGMRKLLANDPDVRRLFDDNGAEIIGNSSAEFAQLLAKEQVEYRDLLNKLKLVRD
jgi:tripartite-type tricarboxylate transporter receptor subunit TctC